MSDSEIDDFVKATHSSNSDRAAAARILISPIVTIALKSILFELKDRDICNALPDAAVLRTLHMAEINAMQRQNSDAKEQ